MWGSVWSVGNLKRQQIFRAKRIRQKRESVFKREREKEREKEKERERERERDRSRKINHKPRSISRWTNKTKDAKTLQQME